MSALLKLTITATLLTAAIASPSHAGNFWFNPDGSGLSPGAQKIIDRGVPAVGSVPFRDLRGPDYVSRSQTVIRSSYGTSVINSTYRSYSRR